MQKILTFMLLLVLAGCKGCDEDKPLPTEPPLTAAFKFYDQVGPYGSPINDPELRMIETDTFYLTKAGGSYDSFRVIYQATDTSADSYTWKVGSDPRTFTGRASALNFDSPGLFPVTLKVSRKNKNGQITIDSLTRSFRIIRTEFHPMLGKYIGYNTSRPDSLFKFYIGHGTENRMVWSIDTIGNFSGYAGYAMTGLQGQIFSSQGIAISSRGAFTDQTWDPSPQFAGNYILKNLFIIPGRDFNSISVDYLKLKIPSFQESTNEKLIPERFIGKRYQ